MKSFLDTWKKKYEAVIVFAGVFDPVHKGHISAAEAALKKHGNTVVFMPERKPQHKHGTTAYQHRLNMLRIATRHDARFQVLDYPEDHQMIKETFEWLGAKYPGRSLIWLVGSDVLPLISKWQNSDQLGELGVDALLCITRDNEDVISKVHDTEVYILRRRRHKHEHISSSFVRENLSERRTALPDGVFDYIVDNKLYSFDSASK